MLPQEASLIGIAAGIVDRADAVQDRSVSSKGVAGHGDDDAATRQPQQIAVLFGSLARNQSLRGGVNEKAAILEMTIERKPGMSRDVPRQVGSLHQAL